MAKPRILVADDDTAVRTVINQALTRAGFDVRLTGTSRTLLDWVSSGDGDVVVSDVIMPDGDALDLLPEIQASRPDLPVIMISAQNTFMTAVRAQEAGAYEYLPKPFDLGELIDVVERAVNEPKKNRTTDSMADYSQGMPLVGRSSAMQEIYRALARLMHSDLAVMLSGESGTGKRLTARVLHDFGNRKSGPFVPVNLGALPPDLIEGELFGRLTGEGSGEPGWLRKADGGTLLLEEIGQLPLAAQTRLLRVLTDGATTPVGGTSPQKIDVRVISTTTRDLDQMIREGSFRDDLFYRLNVVPLRVPPLRERIEDIPDLARHFLKVAELEGSQAHHLDAEAIATLKRNSWPGNVRELENLIRRICILYPQETITGQLIETEIRNSGYFRQGLENAEREGFDGLRGATEYFLDRYFAEFGEQLPPEGVYQRFLAEFEYPVIAAALRATNGNQIKAAEVLGLNRNTLRKKIRQHGIRIVRTAR